MQDSQQQNVNIIYVEDEPSIAQLLVSGLGLFGIKVKPVFSNAESFLKDFDRGIFAAADIFFFDIRLPKMNGVDLATEVRTRGEKRPIVLVSAWPAPKEDVLQKIDANFLPKPFDFPDVIQLVQQLSAKI